MHDWNLQPARDHGLGLAERSRSVRREPGPADSAVNLVWSTAVRAYLKTYHRLRIEGRDNIPADGPYVIVANHASHLDTLVLASAVPWRHRRRVFAVAAGDTFFASPLAGMLSAFLINALPVWRHRVGAHAMQDLRDRLGYDRCRYIVFPEGTRTRTGAIGRFKPGIGMLVAGTPVPVVPCRLTGTFAAFSHQHRVPRPRRVSLSIGEPLRFDHVANHRAGWDEVAAAVRSAVADDRPPQCSEARTPAPAKSATTADASRV
jgi:1-acyl-sn-glycerol-3-phosphate acyltransferase